MRPEHTANSVFVAYDGNVNSLLRVKDEQIMQRAHFNIFLPSPILNEIIFTSV